MLTASFPGSVSWKVRNDSTSWSSVLNKQNKTTLQIIPKPIFHLQKIFKKPSSSQEFVLWGMRLYRGFVRKNQKFFSWSQEKAKACQ